MSCGILEDIVQGNATLYLDASGFDIHISFFLVLNSWDHRYEPQTASWKIKDKGYMFLNWDSWWCPLMTLIIFWNCDHYDLDCTFVTADEIR